VTIRQYIQRRTRWIFALAMTGLLSSLVPAFCPWWLDWVARAWWAFWMLAVVAVIVVGARTIRCPRCGSTGDPDADHCAGCGVSLDEPMLGP
jgi:phosphatidylglycerophosphate synthase